MSMPSQNPGIAMKRMESMRATPSGRLFGLNALRMPTGSPTSQETNSASTPISALMGPRCEIKSATVSPRKNDLPSRPTAMSRSQWTYCTGSGSLSPRSAMMRTRSAGVMRAWPSTPRMATSGSPGRILRMTKMLSDTPSSVTTAYTARRARYFFNVRGGTRDGPPHPPTLLAPRLNRGAPRSRARSSRGRPRDGPPPHPTLLAPRLNRGAPRSRARSSRGGPRDGPPHPTLGAPGRSRGSPRSPEPDLVPPHDVVDAEVGARVLSVDPVVVRVVDLLVGHRDQRRIVLENVFGLPHERAALVVVQLAIDLAGDVVERRIRPARVVLRAVLAVPRAEDVGGIHQRGHNGADGQVEVTGLGFIEPDRRLNDSQVAFDVQMFFEHRLNGDGPELEGRDVAHDEVEIAETLSVSRRRHQLASLLHGRLDVLLIAELFLELGARGRHRVERVDEATHLHRGRVLDDLDQRGAVHGQMDGAAHARIGQRLVLLHVGPEGLDDRLVEVGGGDAGHLLGAPPRDGIEQPRVIHAARQEGRAQLGSERQEMVDLQLVHERQPLVPVVGEALHDPDFLVLARDVLERARARVVHHLAQVALVLLERLLADDDVPAARERAEHVRFGPRLRQSELDRVRIDHDDFAHRREERRARDDHALGRVGDAVVGRLHVLGREIGAVVELDALAQVEGVLLTVGRDLPALREVGNDRLAVLRTAPQQRVVHRALRPDVGHGAGLVDVEVRRRVVHGVAKRAAALGAGIGPDGHVLRRGGAGAAQPRAEHDGAGGAGAFEEAAAVETIVHRDPPAETRVRGR